MHPNGGYYAIDVEGIVAAYEHGLVFGKEDLSRLIATNRDFMWNQQITGAEFQRIDGGKPDPRWKNSPGVLWTALVPHDETLRKVFEANHKPESWGGLARRRGISRASRRWTMATSPRILHGKVTLVTGASPGRQQRPRFWQGTWSGTIRRTRRSRRGKDRCGDVSLNNPSLSTAMKPILILSCFACLLSTERPFSAKPKNPNVLPSL